MSPQAEWESARIQLRGLDKLAVPEEINRDDLADGPDASLDAG